VYVLSAIQFVIFTAMCMVRKIEKFAIFHIFADVMILITVVTCLTYGGINMSRDGDLLL